MIGKDLLKRGLRAAGLELRRVSQDERTILDRAFRCAQLHHPSSKSQLLQDIFVLGALREKRNGFFVEFGAFDGVTLSNTYMLEKEFGWRGILAEPGRLLEGRIKANRSCVLDARCVWSVSGEIISFTETTKPELSTATTLVSADDHMRETSAEYSVETVSLNDLLAQHDAPETVDYLSIDTEGSEFIILAALDFERWRFNVITVEHNWNVKVRTDIQDLLRSRGYMRVLAQFSSHDDWYVHGSLG